MRPKRKFQYLLHYLIQSPSGSTGNGNITVTRNTPLRPKDIPIIEGEIKERENGRRVIILSFSKFE
ncbi:hypothetical protein ACFYKX_10745 [Cytobacillus sp. FJAT-54145]|uniref:Uncharacterized protein n=1 Tax=Cytobacillus spartinae TaxID=3299023 RepID=A0ABW6KED6_9BACI